jgi:hypothetical protein
MESCQFSPWSCDDDGSRVFQNLPSRILRGLSLRNSKYSKWYVRFDRLDEIFAMMCTNSSLEVLLYSEILNILQNKWEQHNSWNSLESNPTTMLCGLFHDISCNSWWLIMSISYRQQGYTPNKCSQFLLISLKSFVTEKRHVAMQKLFMKKEKK